MNLRQLISTDVTASAVAHLSLLAMLVLFSEVHPFGKVTAETIAVDIVTPREVAEKQVTKDEVIETKPEPSSKLPADWFPNAKPTASPQPPPAAQTASPAQSSPPSPAAPAARTGRQQAAARPPATSGSLAPSYAPPEPDLSIKYHVMLGLPPDMSASALPSSAGKADSDFDSPATKAADVATNLVFEFRRHLKTCSKLPAEVNGSDDVKVKLRVFMTPDGRLATDPVLIEASASMKGPLLMKSAMAALQACQPYAMLPVDRYGEWKVLDLGFSPQDLAGG